MSDNGRLIQHIVAEQKTDRGDYVQYVVPTFSPLYIDMRELLLRCSRGDSGPYDLGALGPREVRMSLQPKDDGYVVARFGSTRGRGGTLLRVVKRGPYALPECPGCERAVVTMALVDKGMGMLCCRCHQVRAPSRKEWPPPDWFVEERHVRRLE